MPHVKRYLIPRSWGQGTKGHTFTVYPKGSHPFGMGIPLRVALRDILHLASTARETVSILNQGKILVDKKARKDGAFGIGFQSLLEIPEAKKAYRVQLNSRGLFLEETPVDTHKVCKVMNKQTISGGKMQIGLHDGRTILVEKKSAIKVGDSVKISLPDQKIVTHLPFAKGAQVIITEGQNKGVVGTLAKISPRKVMMDTATVVVHTDKDIETLREYIFVLGGK